MPRPWRAGALAAGEVSDELAAELEATRTQLEEMLRLRDLDAE